MRDNLKKYLTAISFILLTSSISSMDSLPPEELRKMGVEIETSAIKVRDMQSTNIGFLFESGDKQWKLEDDTRDSLKKGEESLYNLELHTVNGYHFNEFMDILKLMSTFVNEIYSKHPQPNEFSTLTLEQAREIIKDHSYKISTLMPHQEDLKILINGAHTKVRPQVTYQVSLDEIPRVFVRLAEIGHFNIKNFVNSLSDGFKDFTIVKRREKEEKFMQLALLNDFNKKFTPILLSGHGLSKKVIGFAYLFLFYWESLFHNGDRDISEEPGPKSSLAIMSRIPFSEMYDHCLNEDEKKQFMKLFDSEINENGKKFLLIDYSQDTDVERDSISLLDWYNSIINRNENISLSSGKKKLTKKDKKVRSARKPSPSPNGGKRYVDLLSPPPQLNKGYSMGAYTIDPSQPTAIVEVRGYPRVLDANIENMYDLLSKEARWFFDHKLEKGDVK